MIIDSIPNLPQYVPSLDNIEQLIKTYTDMPKGEYQITPTTIVKRVSSTTNIETLAKIESHKYHIDIQIPLTTNEHFYIYHSEDVNNNTDYDANKDVQFYEQNEAIRHSIILKPGEFIMLSPGEIHQPQIADGNPTNIEKIVIKIEVTE